MTDYIKDTHTQEQQGQVKKIKELLFNVLGVWITT